MMVMILFNFILLGLLVTVSVMLFMIEDSLHQCQESAQMCVEIAND